MLPRTYPRKFGVGICKLMPQLMTHGEGKPPLCGDRATLAFLSAPWTDWEEADFVPVIVYLRGNIHLELPTEWRDVLPQKIP